ncbi:hypothetical protein SAMN04489752_1190 [Brevibacterium siliguriense]|uniref:Uncharacterized protein n=1 Tax=Brevibacterium siliguriense TaxID=1136497 RepID=A0A1H1Q8U5_9MICO|nr:hypothetical protein [Brevibacterium siliguriense]SDS19866.1 hypothetical protein SAMN04489752_1190 [Brevibacterium siliguriense]
MRHDEERPRTSGFLADGTVPGHWTQVLGSMRANPFTHLFPDEVRAEAAHLLIIAPSPEVAHACFAEMLDSFGDSVEIAAVGKLVPEHVPAGTWVFLPHRQDGWTDLEDASAKLRATLVKENSSREADRKLVLMEYGINLWMWAEPPSSGGDPVCHAGELISWESAWALGASGAESSKSRTSPPAASARPPIYFGLPPILRQRRWES